jgi:DNA-binding PadR family transcriptional regulator
MAADDKLNAELRRGVLQVALLALLRRRAHGYALGKALSAHGLDTEEGTLYPILRRLEQQGYVQSQWDTGGNHPRKYYEITPAGREILSTLVDSLRGIAKSIEDLLREGDADGE